jgi:methyl-accepting chemotaxis protein
MKNKSSLSRSNTQSRLVLVFSVLFVFCVLALSVFLFNILNIVALNDQSRTVFEENRRIYQLETMFKQYHLGLVNYSVTSSELAEMRLTALDQRIDETLLALQEQPPTGNAASFEALAGKKETLAALVAQIIDEVDEQDALDYEDQDWSEAGQLTVQINQQFDNLYADLRLLRNEGRAQLDVLGAQAEFSSLLAMIVGLLSIPAFLGLAFLVAVTIYVQINLPLEQLAQAARDLKERKFNPADLEKLAQRNDEIGGMAREFLKTAQAVQARTSELEHEAAEIRAKIK